MKKKGGISCLLAIFTDITDSRDIFSMFPMQKCLLVRSCARSYGARDRQTSPSAKDLYRRLFQLRFLSSVTNPYNIHQHVNHS